MSSSKFELGQSALILRESLWNSSLKPYASGTVTAVGESCVRVRVKGWFGITRNRWFRVNASGCQVEPVQD